MLDLKKDGFKMYDPQSQGQCPYDRKILLKLHIYGYMNGIRSSRKLETESNRNIEVMWLINKLTPDHGTISSFVKDNKGAFKSILKEFSLLLKGWGLIDGNLVAIDGTKLRANNSKKNYFYWSWHCKTAPFIWFLFGFYLVCVLFLLKNLYINLHYIFALQVYRLLVRHFNIIT